MEKKKEVPMEIIGYIFAIIMKCLEGDITPEDAIEMMKAKLLS
jgi:hypothetical protein